MPIITTSEVLYLNEIAKSLKNRNFYIIRGNMIGCDHISDYLLYTKLDPNFYSNIQFDGCTFNARELSAFVKTITIETQFTFKLNDDGMWSTESMVGGTFTVDQRPKDNFNKIALAESLAIEIPLVPEQDVTADLERLFSLKKDDGRFIYHYKDKYMITLFQPILPLSKIDTIYLTIYPNPGISSVSFIARFRITKKKKPDVYAYLAYLYIDKQ